MRDKIKIENILILLPNWIGDAVLSLPAIYRIRGIFPSAQISVIGLPHIAALFKEYPFIDDIMVYPGKNHKAGLLPAVREIRKHGFDLSILFPNSLRSGIIARLSGIPLRCGYNRDGRRLLLNIPVNLSPEIKKIHQSGYYLNLVNYLESYLNDDKEMFIRQRLTKGYENRQYIPFPPIVNITGYSRALLTQPEAFSDDLVKSFRLVISWSEERLATDLLTRNNIKPRDLIIGINPGAAYGSSKRWYPERYGNVARTLIKKYNGRIIVFGSQKETDIARDIIAVAGLPVLNMAGKTSVRELMALIARCSLMITNDSGPMHIAAALGIPVTAIFGSTDPELSGPLGEGHVVIRKDVSCSPCFRRTCPTDLKCMDIVSVDDVLEGVAKLLQQNS